MIRHFCINSTRFNAFRPFPALLAAASLLTPCAAFAQGLQTETPQLSAQNAAGAQGSVGSGSAEVGPAATQPVVAPPAPAAASSEESPKIHLSAEPPPRKIVFDAAPAPGGMNRTFHYHDGFYLRAGLNYGPGWGGLSLGEDDQTQIDFSGGLLDFNLLIAGTPSPGFSVGGGLVLGTFMRPDMDNSGDNVATSNMSYLLVGPFVDGYFDPNGGWHMGALAGLAGLGKTPHTNGAGGLGGSVWLGYDAWVGADWALGGNLRFTAAAASGTKPVDFSASAMAISLGFSALYH